MLRPSKTDSLRNARFKKPLRPFDCVRLATIGHLDAKKSCMERKLRVKNRFSNRHEQTYCEHDQFAYHVLVRVAGWLVRLTFASMSIEIAGIQLVILNR